MTYSGLWNGYYNEDHSLLTNRTGNAETRVNRAVGNRNYETGAFAETTVEVTGSAAGANTATSSHKRVEAEQVFGNDSQGGLRTIETKEAVNRSTTAADVTRIDDAINQSSQPTTYPVDKAGNGGGGKLGV